MHTKLSLIASAAMFAFMASASLAQESTPVPSETMSVVASAPAETPKVVITTITPDGKKVEPVTNAAPAPNAATTGVDLQAGKPTEPAAITNAAPAHAVPTKVVQAAKPNLCASAKSNFEQVKKTGNAKDFNSAADAMNAACGTGKKPVTSTKPKTVEAKARNIPANLPRTIPVTVTTQAEMEPTYVSDSNASVDPLTRKPLAPVNVSPLRFELYGSFGVASGGVKSIASKAKPAFGVGGSVRYALTEQIGLRAGASLGNGWDAEKREQFTFQQPSGSPLLRPVTRTIVDTTKVELGPQLTLKAGADYQLNQNWSIGANAMLALQNGKVNYTTELLPVGPMPGASLFNQRASKTLFRPGIELFARYTMANNSFLEVAPFFLSGAKITVPGGGKEEVKSTLGVTGRIGWNF